MEKLESRPHPNQVPKSKSAMKKSFLESFFHCMCPSLSCHGQMPPPMWQQHISPSGSSSSMIFADQCAILCFRDGYPCATIISFVSLLFAGGGRCVGGTPFYDVPYASNKEEQEDKQNVTFYARIRSRFSRNAGPAKTLSSITAGWFSQYIYIILLLKVDVLQWCTLRHCTIYVQVHKSAWLPTLLHCQVRIANSDSLESSGPLSFIAKRGLFGNQSCFSWTAWHHRI